MKSFLVKSVLAVCITFCCLFYLDMMYEQKTDNPIAEINVFNFIPDGIQIANVGSSHGQCDFNWDPLTKERGFKTFNFALTSQSYEYDYALINMHKDDFSKGSLLFIPVSYFSYNREATNPNDIEAISVRYYRLLSPQYNPDYSLYKDLVAVRFPVLSAGDEIFELFKPPITFPSLSENRQNIVYAAEAGDGAPETAVPGKTAQPEAALLAEQYASAQTGDGSSADQLMDGFDKFGNQLSGSGTAADGDRQTAGDAPIDAGTESDGAAAAFGAEQDAQNPDDANAAGDEASGEEPAQEAMAPAQTPEEIYGSETVQSFEAKGLARYQRHFEGKESYFEEDKIQDLKNIIELCQERDITPILITTPFTVYYNQYVSDEFLQEFYGLTQSLADTYGINYYDYSHDGRFQTNLQYFGDADHLNEEGAAYFTGLLMEEIPELKSYLASH